MHASFGGDRNHALLRALADRIDATDPGACNNLGVLYYAKGLHADAVAAFLRALALAPRMRVAARNLEVAAAHAGACDAPIRALEARMAADANDRDARRELARLMRLLGRTDDAVALLEALLADDPDDGTALRELGLLEQAGGDLRKAQRWLERALAIAPDDGWARLHLAEVLYHRGANRQALRELDTLLARDEALADAHLLRSFVLGDLGQQEAASAAAQRARALDPALATLQADLALDPRLAPTSGAPAGSAPAIPITRGLLETPSVAGVISNESLARYSLGLAFRQRGYFAEARREFERADSLGEDPLLVRHALAELDLVQGLHAEARQRLEALLAERGDDARRWNEHGVALHQGGEVGAAADSYRRALRVDPRYALAYNNLGVALHDLGEAAPAREALVRATQVDPTLVRARLNLAHWHLRHRDPLTALAVLRELVAFHPQHADAWHAMALAYTDLDRLDEARQAVTTAIEHRSDHAEARYTLAELLTVLGDADGALRETQLALGLSPVRIAPRLTVGIALQDECPDTIGSIDLLTLRADEPLAGTAVAAETLDSLLPEAVPAAAPCDGPAEATERLCALERALRAETAGVVRCEAQALLAAVGGRRTHRWTLVESHALIVLADAFATEGLHGEADERYRQARALLDAHPASGDAVPAAALTSRAVRGTVRSACLLGRGAEVVSWLDALSTDERRDPEVLALLAAVHAARPDGVGARIAAAAIDRLLREPLRSAALLHFVGDAAHLLGDHGRALTLYRRALAFDPTRPSPRLAIARLLLARGDLLAAHLELVAALASAPRWREAQLALAALHHVAGRHAEAVRMLRARLAQAPRDVDALAQLAEVLAADGRAVEAREAVRRARRLEPEHPLALLVDGSLLAAQGRHRDARGCFERLLATEAPAPFATRARAALAALDASRTDVLPTASVAPTASRLVLVGEARE